MFELYITARSIAESYDADMMILVRWWSDASGSLVSAYMGVCDYSKMILLNMQIVLIRDDQTAEVTSTLYFALLQSFNHVDRIA